MLGLFGPLISIMPLDFMSADLPAGIRLDTAHPVYTCDEKFGQRGLCSMLRILRKFTTKRAFAETARTVFLAFIVCYSRYVIVRAFSSVLIARSADKKFSPCVEIWV